MDKWTIIKCIIFIILIGSVIGLSVALQNARKEKDVYQRNMNAALIECSSWKTKDSLSVAKNETLELTISELKKYRSEDLKLINSIKKRNEDLERMVSNNSETKIQFITEIRDSIIYVKDTITPVQVVNWNDQWAEFHGIIKDKSMKASLINRDSLIVAETIEYKRFLCFLWKTHKIKNRSVIITSKNPHTEIKNVELIEIR